MYVCVLMCVCERSHQCGFVIVVERAEADIDNTAKNLALRLRYVHVTPSRVDAWTQN